jgi:hypothetical protein
LSFDMVEVFLAEFPLMIIVHFAEFFFFHTG